MLDGLYASKMESTYLFVPVNTSLLKDRNILFVYILLGREEILDDFVAFLKG